jgi:hypothetical protein
MSLKQKTKATQLKFRGVVAVGGSVEEAASIFAKVLAGKDRKLIVSSDNGLYAINANQGVKHFDPKLGVEHARVFNKEISLTLASDGDDKNQNVLAFLTECSTCNETVLAERKIEHCPLCAADLPADSYEKVQLDIPSSDEINEADDADISADVPAAEASDDTDAEEAGDESDIDLPEDDDEDGDDFAVAGDDDADEEDEPEFEGDADIVADEDDEAGDDADADEDDAAADDQESLEESSDDDAEGDDDADDSDVADDEAPADDADDSDAGDDDADDDDEPVDDSDADDSAEAGDDAPEDSDEYFINDEGAVNIDLLNDAAPEEGDAVDVEYSAAASGSKRWLVSVASIPVASITEESAGRNKGIFHTEAFAKVVNEVIAKDGLPALAGIGFSPIVISAPIRSLIADQVAVETSAVTKDYETKTSALAKDFQVSMGIASAGINRGFFSEIVNPIKARMWEELSRLSIPAPHRIIDRVFKDVGEEYSRVLIEKASELHGKSPEVRSELAKSIIGTNYLEVAEACDEDDSAADAAGAVADHIEATAMPFGNHVIRTAEESSTTDDFSSKLKSVMSSL